MDEISKKKFNFSLPYVYVSSRSCGAINEDSFESIVSPNQCAIFIADGVGSSLNSNIAADLVVSQFKNSILLNHKKLVKDKGCPLIDKIWKVTEKKLIEYAKLQHAEYNREESFLKTTLLAVIELPDYFVITYIGNGNIFHIRGDIWKFFNNDSYTWPFIISSLMSPDIDAESGNLFGYLGPKGLSTRPHIIRINKNMQQGDIFILTTDGISSPESESQATYGNHGYLRNNDILLKFIFKYLPSFFKELSLKTEKPGIQLGEIVDKFISETKFKNDDATFGLLITPVAVKAYIDSQKF